MNSLGYDYAGRNFSALSRPVFPSISRRIGSRNGL